jgi:hypothetical protein
MTFFFIPWRPVISRFAQNAAHHLCSSVFKASVGCPIFPRLDAQTVDARKPLPTTTTGHLRIAPKAAGSDFVGLSALCARRRGKSQNAPAAISESPSLSLGQFYSQAGFERAKVRQSHGFAGLPAGSFEPVSVSHPLNFKGKFRTATPASSRRS